MDIRRLEAFAKVYEMRSFSKAGQELYLSQPTISAHVSALEAELEVRLFDRLGRSILPTQAAEVLYRHAQDIFARVASARAEIQLLQERVAGDLAVGGSTIPAHYVLPTLLARFVRQHPEVRVELRGGDSQSVVRRLLEGEELVALVGAAGDHPDLVFEPILRDELVVLGPVEGPAAPGPECSPQELAALPWVVREPGSGTRRAFEQSLARAGQDPRGLKTALTVESTQAALACVRAGLGLTATSRLAARPLLEAGQVREVRVPGLDMQRNFYLVYHARRHQFPVMRYFIEFLRRECSLSR
ncbi:selenium metabolism-associated LysR family transcriptional regulator [Desulfocurvus sp.]|jgi:DNA-binding transcriptional LysR family regulator|uniref:selenium metabolism-associated LysR family transcriptional regulator n=1 Tax=Desulfocurvus sp. TaxID=2871698 RepID=UPI0025C4EB17|nr:selenium metabolism-associated LysR family transcriptional regulator [Desulfocurvus sp.]MCK9239764.1 selenium metabolism-associated LysR family transcriptional regulator [Desulfocurvus sp.]